MFCKQLYTPDTPFLVENIQRHVVEDYIKTDKMMLVLLILHWLVASTITSLSYGFYWLGLLGGGSITFIAFIAYFFLRGTIYSRIVIGISFMLFSAVFIQQHLGRIEMHFHVFIALAFLIRYKDILPILAGAFTTVVHHLAFNYCQAFDLYMFNIPIRVYNYGDGLDITLIHIIFVVIAVSIYYFIIQQISAQFCLNLYISEKYQHTNHEKNEFFGVVVHDLKNPLAVTQSIVDMLETDIEHTNKEELLEMLGMIRLSSKQMFGLVTNLLDVNMIESGKITIMQNYVDILPIMHNVLKYHTERAEAKDITLHLQAKTESFRAFIDPNITHQILDNLLSNAIKYSPHHKDIYIRIIGQEQYVQCEIQDQGPGLNAEEQKQLFQKFTRLTPQPTGGEHSTGLGLFIVKKLVESMQGNVWCHSQIGNGSTFVVVFPKQSSKQ